MNARPGPESATWSIVLLDTLAMKPSTEKITKPDKRHVPSLKHAKIRVSLFPDRKTLSYYFPNLEKSSRIPIAVVGVFVVAAESYYGAHA